jgi:hypothetical protein
MVHQWVTKGSIDNARRPGRGSMMRPTINEESDCLRKNNLRRRKLLNRNDEKWPHSTRQIKIAGRNHIVPPLRN